MNDINSINDDVPSQEQLEDMLIRKGITNDVLKLDNAQVRYVNDPFIMTLDGNIRKIYIGIKNINRDKDNKNIDDHHPDGIYRIVYSVDAKNDWYNFKCDQIVDNMHIMRFMLKFIHDEIKDVVKEQILKKQQDEESRLKLLYKIDHYDERLDMML